MSSDDVVLRIRHVSKRFEIYDKPRHRLQQMLFGRWRTYFREFWALRDIDFEVRKGECVGIIGRNGAGKSTLLQIVTGTLQPTEGTVERHGRIAALLELGSGFNPEFTGRENVYMNAAILGLTKAETDAKYDNIVAFADIGEFIDQPVKTYSSGMMVRLAFAVNAFVDPDILIVDEALAVGDIGFQAKCYARIRKLLEENRTILFVTHDMASLVRYCSVAYLLENGQCIASGMPNDIVNDYKIRMARDVSAVSLDRDDYATQSSVQTIRKPGLDFSKDRLEYGDHKAEIKSFRILDKDGNLTTELIGSSEYSLQVDLIAHERIVNPIVAFTIRDAGNVELCGTNTGNENVDIPPWEPGTEHQVEFRFKPALQTKEYLLMLGCTEYMDGGLAVHHRLYDVCALRVENIKKFTGQFAIPVTTSYRKLK